MRGLPGTSRTPAGAGRAAAWRVAAVAVLLAVTTAGLRARGTSSHAPDRALAGAGGAVLATILIEPPRPPFPWWAKTLAVLAAFSVLVTPLVVLLTRRGRFGARRGRHPGRGARPGHRGRAGQVRLGRPAGRPVPPRQVQLRAGPAVAPKTPGDGRYSPDGAGRHLANLPRSDAG